MQQVGNLLSYFLAGQSPPRVAKDVGKWGKNALEVFLRGMGEADYGTLTDLVGGKLNKALKGIMKSYFGVADAAKAVAVAEERLLDLLLPPAPRRAGWGAAGSRALPESFRRGWPLTNCVGDRRLFAVDGSSWAELHRR